MNDDTYYHNYKARGKSPYNCEDALENLFKSEKNHHSISVTEYKEYEKYLRDMTKQVKVGSQHNYTFSKISILNFFWTELHITSPKSSPDNAY